MRERSRSGDRCLHSLVLLLLPVCCVVLSGCFNAAPTAQPTPLSRALRTARLEGQPLELMLPSLHPDNRKFIEDFAATVPPSLPEQAYVSTVILDPASPAPEGPLIVKQSNGYADVEMAIANVGTNTNQPNVICLRNDMQVGCTPEVDVWEVALPPKTLALVSTRISASPGDSLIFLFLAQDEPKRIYAASQIKRSFVEQHSVPPSTWIDAPGHDKIFGGCNFVALVKDPTDTRTSPVDLFRHSTTPRGIMLYLLFQLCNPTGQEYVQLLPIVNRTKIVDLPGKFWHSPIWLSEANSVISVDTAPLGPVHEFQVAIVPLSAEAESAFRHKNFTQAVVFSD
jgi:hypothetical protein